eukprot:1632898-Pyramimonas_sp.AAC.1
MLSQLLFPRLHITPWKNGRIPGWTPRLRFRADLDESLDIDKADHVLAPSHHVPQPDLGRFMLTAA